MMAALSLFDRTSGLRGVGGAAALLLGVFALPASAQVMEIDGAGMVTTYDRPMMFNADAAAPLGAVATSAASTPWAAPEIAEAARAHGLPPTLLEAVVWQESRGRMAALSPKGAVGIMQLMPATAAALGVDPYDRADNIRGGALYLSRQIERFGSVELGLAAYNAGPGAVARYGGIPPFRETRAYVARILARWRAVPSDDASPALANEVLNL